MHCRNGQRAGRALRGRGKKHPGETGPGSWGWNQAGRVLGSKGARIGDGFSGGRSCLYISLLVIPLGFLTAFRVPRAAFVPQMLKERLASLSPR